MVEMTSWGEINTKNEKEADVAVMGIPFDSAVSCGKGAALGPEKLRELSRYLPPVSEEGIVFETLKVYDSGDVPIDLNWNRYYENVEEKAHALMGAFPFTLFLGGDHSVTIPLHKAFGRRHAGKKMGIIHFDSHADICHEYDGHIWSHACTERRAVDDVIDSKDLALIGIRSWEVEEVEYLKENPEVLVIRAKDIHEKGYRKATERILEKYKGYDALYFTLDIDVLDPSCAPGTGTPEPGGPSNREIMEMVKVIIKELPVKSMDLVEVSPPLDTPNHITSWAGLKIIYEVFGQLSLKK